MALSFRVDLEPFETQTSFASRLTGANMAEYLQYFATDMRMQLDALVRGDDVPLRRLAELGGVEFDRLHENAVIGFVSDGHQIRGHFFERRSLMRHALRLCPVCIENDLKDNGPLGPYGRAHWHVTSIRTCCAHSMPLLRIDALHSPRTPHDFYGRVEDDLELILAAAKSTPKRSATALEQYLFARFMNTAEPNWLNQIEMQVATKTCEMLGAVLIYGPNVNLDAFTDDDWLAAGAKGFAIAVNGRDAVCDALSYLQKRPGSPTGGPQAHWGRFYQWLAYGQKGARFKPILDLAREHIISSYPIAVGTKILGETCETRKVHSLMSAQKETGLHPKRLRTLLIDEGFLPEDDGQVQHGAVGFFDAVAADEFLMETSESIGQPEAQKLFGISRSQFDVMRKWGFIRPVTISKHAKPRYSRLALKRFKKKLLRDAVSVQQAKPTQVDIQTAARKAVCSTAEIVHMIVDRKLNFVGCLHGRRSLRYLVVDADEVLSKLKTEVIEGVSKAELKSLLGVNDSVVKWLTENGYLPTQATRSQTSRKAMSVVRHEDYDCFDRKYITLRNLAREWGLSSQLSASKLLGSSVKPIDQSGGHGQKVYVRREVEKFQQQQKIA